MDDDWANVDPDDYVETKTAFAEKLIKLFEERYGVTVTPYIEELEIATPWTMCSYVNVRRGRGLRLRAEGLGQHDAANDDDGYRFPVKGLKFVGAASIRGDGYNSAIFSGDTLAKRLSRK